MLYQSLGEAVIRYGLTIWGTTNKTLLNKVEKIQNKMVMQLDPTERNVYKIYKNLNILPIPDLLQYILITDNFFSNRYKTIRNAPHDIVLRNIRKYNVPSFINAHGKRTLEHIIPKLFNKLPQNIESSETISQLKNRLRHWLLEKYDNVM